jgi:ASC-1-like (ASCH) protein
MNKRIRELAFQAMSINQKVSDDSFFVEVSKLNEFEKFAELIIEECIELNKQELAFNAFERMLNRYKEHFGVEE